MKRKPIIGLTANITPNGDVGTIAKLGAKSQEWQLLAEDYVKAVEVAGGVPIIIPITEDPKLSVALLSFLDGLIFTGGNDVNPVMYGQAPDASLGEVSIKRDAAEQTLLKAAVDESEIPILAICRGCQLLNVTFGGTLHQDVIGSNVTKNPHFLLCYPIEAVSQKATLSEESKLFSILGSNEIGINSFHHQAIDKVGQGLKVVARADDNVIEAVEVYGERFIVGVQWHPEMMLKGDYNYIRLFKAFIDSCYLTSQNRN